MDLHMDPDEWVYYTTHTTCDFHRRNPGVPYAGCICSTTYGMRKATKEEYQENRRQRLEKEKEELQRKLFHINLELSDNDS